MIQTGKFFNNETTGHKFAFLLTYNLSYFFVILEQLKIRILSSIQID